jgi:GT2 family glycosyltransferase
MSKDIAIVIPFHNSAFWIRDCLKSILNSGYFDTPILVVNDASHKDEFNNCLEIISLFSKLNIKLITNKGRRGFGGACNYASTLLPQVKFILFLNSDCLITKETISALLNPLIKEPSALMSCPVSNNSPMYSLEMPPGLNFYKLSNFFYNWFNSEPQISKYKEAATIVGNCLMVNRQNFQTLKGFDSIWGLGYGEETDLQMRGILKGFKSFIVMNTYVFHHGGGSFGNNNSINLLKSKNHKKFISKWNAEYKKLLKRDKFPVLTFLDALAKKIDLLEINYDFIFYLPIISQEIGGIHSVVNICNDLTMNGYSCTIVLIGNYDSSILEGYSEPLMFSPLFLSDDDAFLLKKMNYKYIVSTVNTSASLVAKLKNKKSVHIQYIQGYEILFDNCINFNVCLDSYKYGDIHVYTSRWLKEEILENHTSKNQRKSYVINPYVDPYIFYKGSQKKREFDLAFFMRNAPDKGQFGLGKILAHKEFRKKKLLVFGSKKYNFFQSFKNVTYIEAPITRYKLSNFLRRTTNFIDLSSHEGYGLLGAEALACGARFFYTYFGGNTDYTGLEDSFLIENPLDTDLIFKKIFINNTKKMNKRIKPNSDIKGWQRLLLAKE